ncbi:TPA: ABC-F family ATP-binding cassette domain-containing protein, partial [Enterococcus faecalis]|nr:ABC-F family ATP-binding cassette domain-containing protein [Enterococcus faecalis]
SSILKLINGDDIKFTGNFMLASGLKISYISQDTSYLKGNLSEFAYNNKIDETLFKTILRKLDFNREQFDKNMVDFSAGQKKKVLIAKSLCESAHLYIWDEPLNYIDIFSRIQIEKMILEYCPTLLFVEHDDAFCNNICTKNINLGL